MINEITQIIPVCKQWEQNFLLSIKNLLEKGYNLSEKQESLTKKIIYEKLDKIMIRKIDEESKEDFSPIIFKDKEKEKIQKTAYQKWEDNNYKGTLEIATGVGKTFIGLMAVLKNIDKKIIIVVPKCDLQKQWIDELKLHLKLTDNDIGKVGDGFKEYDKKIIVAVVNSIRNEMLSKDLLIMDEMHRYGSKENFKFLKNGMFKKVLGLSATVIREDGNEHFLYKYAPLIYSYGQKEAIKNNILTKFLLYNMNVPLTTNERVNYESVSYRIKELFPYFENDFHNVQSGVRCGNQMALELMKKFQIRRNIVLNAELKIDRCIEIIRKKEKSKALIFCEYISMAEDIVKCLNDNEIPSVKFHSKLKKKEKNQMLEDFKNNKYKVMVTVKSLDEGTNIPDCDLGIIVGGTAVSRQSIQRFGRLLRKSEEKETATIYQLYVAGTKDYDWMKKRTEELMKNAERVIWE